MRHRDNRVPIHADQLADVDKAGRRLLIHTPKIGPDCRCRSCGHRRATRHPDPRCWTKRHDHLLRELYGTTATALVAAALNRRFGRPQRTESSVYTRAQDLKLQASARSWGAYRLALALGVAPDTLYGWLDDGTIASFSVQRQGASLNKRRVLHGEAQRFVRQHWRRLDLDGISDTTLRSIHQFASRRVRALSTTEALRQLETTRDKLRAVLDTGCVPGAFKVEGIRGGYGRSWGWRILETSLPVLRELLEAQAERYRIERAAQWAEVQPKGTPARWGRAS
jgi:hypothetical protein